jgi:hypothetical protein
LYANPSIWDLRKYMNHDQAKYVLESKEGLAVLARPSPSTLSTYTDIRATSFTLAG